MKTIIVAPDSFKGSLSSAEASEIMAQAIESVENCNVVKLPLADGGEGTLEIAASLFGSVKKSVKVMDSLGRYVDAEYVLNGKTAIIESAQSCGLTLLSKEERNPLYTSTYGVGQLVLSALRDNAEKIIITLGGSATNDCGIGFLCALGAELKGEGVSSLPNGGDLNKINGINIEKPLGLFRNTRLIAVCDVNNTLYGKNGAARVFAPQKGADEETVEILDRGLRRFSEAVKESVGVDIASVRGAGAAGGLGAALKLLGAETAGGAETVLSVVGFDKALKTADYVFTGEGTFDDQSFMGKVAGTVYAHASREKVPTVVFAGDIKTEKLSRNLRAVRINPEGVSLNDAMKNARENLYGAVLSFVKNEID